MAVLAGLLAGAVVARLDRPPAPSDERLAGVRLFASAAARQPQKRRTTSYRTGKAPSQGIDRDPLVDAVEALEEALVGVEQERREAIRRDAEASVCLASVANGTITGKGMASGSWSTMVETRRSYRAPSAGDSTGGPKTISSISQTAASAGPSRSTRHRPHLRLGRAGQDPAVDLDHGVAGDDVVLDPGVDDVRADRCRAGARRSARAYIGSQAAVKGGLGAVGSSPDEAAQDAAAPGGSSAAAGRGSAP